MVVEAGVAPAVRATASTRRAARQRGVIGDFAQALYQQVWDVLAERITSGVWKPGAVIPN